MWYGLPTRNDKYKIYGPLSIKSSQYIQRLWVRNEVLSAINEELETLSTEGVSLSEKALHKEINRIVGSYKKFVDVKVSRKSSGPCVTWKFKKHEILKAERMDRGHLSGKG